MLSILSLCTLREIRHIHPGMCVCRAHAPRVTTSRPVRMDALAKAAGVLSLHAEKDSFSDAATNPSDWKRDALYPLLSDDGQSVREAWYVNLILPIARIPTMPWCSGTDEQLRELLLACSGEDTWYACQQRLRDWLENEDGAALGDRASGVFETARTAAEDGDDDDSNGEEEEEEEGRFEDGNSDEEAAPPVMGDIAGRYRAASFAAEAAAVVNAKKKGKKTKQEKKEVR